MIGPVIDWEWLQAHRDEVALVDVRWYLDGRSGRAAYEEGHLPRAVFVDLEHQLSGPPGPGTGRHPFPDAASFASAMSSLGIGDETPVVAYDDQGGVVAGRLVWMLRAIDHEAALLDGGLSCYDGPLDRDDPVVVQGSFTVHPWPTERLAGIDDATDPTNTVIDARSRDRYRGGEDPIDARAGHIPGALSVPCRENLGSDGRFLPAEALRVRFEEAGITPDTPVVAYCGSGVSACHNLLAIELAGLGRGRLYPGSWSHYSQELSRPVATGDS